MTLNVDLDDHLANRLARIAQARRTLVEDVVREELNAAAARAEAREAEQPITPRKRLAELIESSKADIGPGYIWSREGAYADRMFPRHQRSDLRGGGKDE